MKKSDRELGMDREITRRDFLNGTSAAIGGAGAIGAAVLSGTEATAAEPPTISSPRTPPAQGSPEAGDYYPPRLTGMRGSHEGSFEVAHEMRDGRTWDDAEDTGESYDLIVVGGRIERAGSRVVL